MRTNDIWLEAVYLSTDCRAAFLTQIGIDNPLDYHTCKPTARILSKVGRTEGSRSRRAGDRMPGCAGEQLGQRFEIFGSIQRSVLKKIVIRDHIKFRWFAIIQPIERTRDYLN